MQLWVLPVIPTVGVNESKLWNAGVCGRWLRVRGSSWGRVMDFANKWPTAKYQIPNQVSPLPNLVLSLFAATKKCQSGTAPTFLGYQELGSHHSLWFVQGQKEEAASERQLILFPLRRHCLAWGKKRNPTFLRARHRAGPFLCTPFSNLVFA